MREDNGNNIARVHAASRERHLQPHVTSGTFAFDNPTILSIHYWYPSKRLWGVQDILHQITDTALHYLFPSSNVRYIATSVCVRSGIAIPILAFVDSKTTLLYCCKGYCSIPSLKDRTMGRLRGTCALRPKQSSASLTVWMETTNRTSSDFNNVSLVHLRARLRSSQ